MRAPQFTPPNVGNIRSEDRVRRERVNVGNMRVEDRVLRERVIALLRQHGGNVAAVGRAMGKAPIQIRRWCRRLQIELSQLCN